MDLQRCDTCGGYTGEVPENYEGEGVPACFCNRERHIEEELHRAGAPNSNVVDVIAAESIRTEDKMR